MYCACTCRHMATARSMERIMTIPPLAPLREVQHKRTQYFHATAAYIKTLSHYIYMLTVMLIL